MSSYRSRNAVAAGVAVVLAMGGTAFGQSGPARSSMLGRLAPGDDVVVTVFREKELSARVYVDDRGEVVLPRLGVINVTTLTTDMLRDTIRARYSTFLREPSIDLQALRRITVNGAVLKPDVYYVDPSMMLRDVIARAGGVTAEGSTRRVSVVRGSKATPYPNWSGTEEGQTELRSGDEVVVGRRSWVSLNIGAVIGLLGLASSLAITFLRK